MSQNAVLISWVIDRFMRLRVMGDLGHPRSYVLCGVASGWRQLRNGDRSLQLRKRMLCPS
jgi:hypothetical protein